MASPITPITGISLPAAAPSIDIRSAGGGFQDVFAAAVRSVETSGQGAAASVEQFLSGEGGELHSVIMETQRAELAFDLMLQMRNKVVNAYQEIMRMQV